MAKIKGQKKKKATATEKPEIEEVAPPSTRKSDDPIPKKVKNRINLVTKKCVYRIEDVQKVTCLSYFREIG